jgi:hypothetical protein
MERGVMQGSSISGLIFNLTQADPISRIRNRHPQALILSLHDDHPPTHVLAAAEDLAASLGEIGLDINFAKSKMFSLKEPARMPSCQIQACFYIARVSFQQQLGYWLRCTPWKQTRPAARILDRKILNIEGEALAWSDAGSPFFERIFLPIRLGGCGITSSKATHKALTLDPWHFRQISSGSYHLG